MASAACFWGDDDFAAGCCCFAGDAAAALGFAAGVAAFAAGADFAGVVVAATGAFPGVLYRSLIEGEGGAAALTFEGTPTAIDFEGDATDPSAIFFAISSFLAFNAFIAGEFGSGTLRGTFTGATPSADAPAGLSPSMPRVAAARLLISSIAADFLTGDADSAAAVAVAC